MDGRSHAAAIHDPTSSDPDVVRSIKRAAMGRRCRHLAKERLDAIEPCIPLGKKFWALADEERAALKALFEDEQVA